MTTNFEASIRAAWPADLSDGARQTMRALYRRLAAGRAVHVDATARHHLARLPPAWTRFDDDGRLVALTGFDTEAGPYRLEMPAGAGFAWCAFDCLFLPALLGTALIARGTCPVTGANVTVPVTTQAVGETRPGDVSLSFVSPDGDVIRTAVREHFCRHVKFLAGDAAARAWRREHPQSGVLSLHEGFTLGQLRNQIVLGPAMDRAPD